MGGKHHAAAAEELTRIGGAWLPEGARAAGVRMLASSSSTPTTGASQQPSIRCRTGMWNSRRLVSLSAGSATEPSAPASELAAEAQPARNPRKAGAAAAAGVPLLPNFAGLGPAGPASTVKWGI
jgi:hypothetical protein